MQQLILTQLTPQDFKDAMREVLQNIFVEMRTENPDIDLLNNEQTRYVTKKEAARLMKASVSWIDNMRRAGKLTPHRMGRKSIRFDRDELMGLLTRNKRYNPYAATQNTNKNGLRP